MALNRRFSYVARKFEVTNFVLPGPPLLDPLSCSWRVPLPCETFRSLSERISIPGSLWIHSIPDTLIDLRGSLNGGHLPAPLPTRSNVIHLYFVIHYGNSRRSKFLRESRSIIIIYNSIRGWICYILDDSHFNSKIFL